MRYYRSRLLTRVSAPATEPLTLAEAKMYLRIDGDDEDLLIGDLIVAARMVAEEWLKRSLITQSWKLSYDDYIHELVPLPMGPVASVTSVVVSNRDASTQIIDDAVYTLNSAKDALVLDTIVFGFRVEITYVAGYGSAAAVPKPVKQGMLEHIAAMYENRGEIGEVALPGQATRLYMPFREVRL
jgi:uncharacterized phiE125 gp8 family phage protein